MKYKISELSNLLNVSTNTVRRYEQMGYITSSRTQDSNYRYYSEDDITKFMNARLLRKYGFTHTEISKMKSYDMPELIASNENRMEKMDEQIAYLSNLRHRLKDDIVLMKKVDVFKQPGYIKDCVPLSYVLYQRGEKLLKESKRIMTVQDYLYLSPEVQRIYLIRKEDAENDNIVLNMGWAIKIVDLDRYNIKENEYTERYDKRKSLLTLAKLPVNTDKINKCNNEQLKDMLLKEPLKYMNEHNLKIDGDIIGIVITIVIEDDEEMQYLLISIPIAEM